jgi:hypothetical protein
VTVPSKALTNLIEWAQEQRDALYECHLDPVTNLVEPNSVAKEIREIDAALAKVRASHS